MRKYLKCILLFIMFFSCFMNVFAQNRNKKDTKISVIVPVYNVKNYLDTCINSITNQSYKNLEIICINDGSTDNSLTILQRYENNDNRIKIINQYNRGVSSARNRGIEIATGEYISFVDPDDKLELNAYEVLMNKIQDNVDILAWSYNAFPNTSSYWIRAGKSNNATYNNDSVNAYFNGKSISVVVWNKLYRSEMIKNCHLRFNENLKMGEDVEFNMISFSYAKKIQFISDCLYNYRLKREGSLTDRYKGKMLPYNHKILFKNVLNSWKKSGVLRGNQHRILEYFIRMSYNVINSVPERSFKRSYARELLNLFWSYMEKNSKNKLTPDTRKKFYYIKSLAR